MATSKDTGSGSVHECFYRCDSREHASNLTAVITKGSLSDEKVAAYLKWCCVKYAQALDSYGRSLIHVAAAKGRLKLLMFLLTHREVNINAKDQESLYTSLHRSLFYGQLHCAVRLIQSGANLQQCDLDELTPLDHAMKDRPSILTYDSNQPCEVYVWGTNTNYNLGIGHHHSRTNPEPLDFFRKENISIKQALMSKFHSLFLGSNGKVWSCGLGSGGRLGLGNEATTLVPKALKIGSSSSESCKAASVGIDHSILLMENGSVWSFGLNNYHQLGHSPPPEKILFPKAIKSLKGLDIVGISASKFHSVFWTKNQLFTCGLHGGQLGHLKTSENTIPNPKFVTVLQLKSTEISHVATSDGATVVVNSKGDIYLFHEYQCKKLTTKTSKFVTKKVCVLGGHLDHKVHTSSLQEKGGDELKILILTNKNTIYLWQESCQQMTRCLLSLRRYIDITDVALNRVSLILTTRDGEAFQGEIKVRKRKHVTEDEKSLSPKSSFIKFLDKDDCDYIKVKRIPHIHRAVNASSDTKGRNFAVVQVHPKTGLLEVPLVEWTEMKQNMKVLLTTASEFDTVHDVVFEVEGVKFPAHRYVVSHSCEVLEEMINKSEVVDDVCHVKIDNVQPQIFERVLCYLYSGECDLLQIGICPVSFDPNVNDSKEDSFIRGVGGGGDMTVGEDLTFKKEIINSEAISAFEYHRQQQQQQQQQRSNKKRNESSRTTESKAKDPIRALRDAARIFELTSLAKKLENFRYENGYISKRNDQNVVLEPPKFNRKHLQNLWDITIRSENGIMINAHKCILVARLEYFNCMINQGWLESSLKAPLNLSIPSTVLEILIRYLYTDEAPEVVDTDDADLASHVLVIADQLFCTRLKEIAEASLGNMINLKNAAEVLQLAVTYRASQLKQCAMEFICLNLSALLELRSLEILDDELLTDLRDFYRSWLPCMNRRSIATYVDAPDDEFVETIYNTEPVSLDKVEEETATVKTNSKTPKKKSQREKKTSESSGRARNTSVGSTTSDEELFSSLDYSDTGVKEEEEEAWIMVTNHSAKQQKSSQMKSNHEVGSPKGVTTSVPKATLIPIPKPTVNPSPPKPVPMVSLKTESIPIQKSTPINVSSHPNRVIRNSFNETDKDGLVLSTSSEKEFPALSASAPDRITTIISPKSPSEGFKKFEKFVKLSQKQRKKLAIQSISENKETEMKPEETVKTVWGITKMESPTMADIMKEESKASFNSHIGSLASSPPWQGPSSPSCSLSAIMAAERHQRDMITRMKSKPLEYTQMEDKAIDDLILLYDISNVTDERITVRRADSVFISPPVWVSSHR